jgi:hypothetical protein
MVSDGYRLSVSAFPGGNPVLLQIISRISGYWEIECSNLIGFERGYSTDNNEKYLGNLGERIEENFRK